LKSVIGIRNETKSHWERRVPLTPSLIARLVDRHDIRIMVQPSSHRIFPDKDFVRAGAEMKMDLGEVSVIFGVKEIPEKLLDAGTTYMFFSHVIKGQPYNMPMLSRLMELGCTLIDYEMVRDDSGKRLIFFGRYAGLAGMIDALWTLGRRFSSRGIKNPLEHLQPAHAYADLEEARTAIRRVGQEILDEGLPVEMTPLVIGVAGYGNVARGAQEILAELPIREISPSSLGFEEISDSRVVYRTTFREKDLVAANQGDFDLQEYYAHPEAYHSIIEEKLPFLSLLINANYWDERYPRLLRNEWLRDLYSGPEEPKLQVIGDLGCDIGGNIECTVKCTEPGDPVFTWIPETGEIVSGVEPRGPAILAVDILPTELPREASEEFARALEPFVKDIASADYSRSFEDLDLPSAIKRAVIVHRGKLTPEFLHLEESLRKVGLPG